MSRDSIPGWATYTWIYREWLASDPRKGAVVVEVGVAIGKTITYAADAIILAGRRDIELWAVDPWAGTARNAEQSQMADAAGGDFALFASMMLQHDRDALQFARVVRAPSVQASKLFEPGSVDLVLLDGDHSYDGVRADIDAWLPKLRAGGWIGGDDHHATEHPGVVKACKETFGNKYKVDTTKNEWNAPTWLARR